MIATHTPVFRSLAGLVLLLVVLDGCSTKTPEPAPPVPAAPIPLFPPQEALTGGDFSGFAEANKKTLETCDSDDGCATALFNLGVVHAYPPAPIYNQSEALKYFRELIARYPDSPWASQAKFWVELLRKTVAFEKDRRQLRKEIKARKSDIEELNEQIRRSRDIDSEIDQKEQEQLRQEIKERESAIEELSEQIRRSRDIDSEIDRKERELLK